MDTLLLTTNRDPRKDRRVAELVRIGAGIGAWNKVRVDIFLRGHAALALDEFPDELADGNLIQEYLPMLQNHGGEIYVEKANTLLKKIQSRFPFKTVNRAESAELIKRARYSINL
jgi:hypothetical protein